MRVKGIEGMSGGELREELDQGAKFVIYEYCFSILFFSFKRPSNIYFVKHNDNAILKGLGFTLVSLLAGWWAVPFGPIYTIQSLFVNFSGGKDVTEQVLQIISLPGG